MAKPTLLLTQGSVLTKVRKVNCTDTSFDALAYTTTEPIVDAQTATGRAAIDLVNRSGGVSNNTVPNSVQIFPFGAGSDDQTFDMRVIGWKPAIYDSLTIGWIPYVLAGFSCTLSTSVGVAGSTAVATDRFVDTITRISAQGNDVSSEIVSPANNTPGHVVVDLKGCLKWEVSFDMTGATNGNALYGYL